MTDQNLDSLNDQAAAGPRIGAAQRSGFTISHAAIGAVLGAAAFGGSAYATARHQAALLDEANIGVAKAGRGTDTSWAALSSIQEPSDPHLLSETARKAAAGAALGGLVGSLFGLFGGNWLINFLAGLGASLWQVTKKLAKAPVKAVKYAAAATGSMVRKHGKWLAIVGGLALVAFTGVVFFDAQWKAGLVIGAGLAGASFYGLKRGRKFGAGLMAKVSPKKTANAAA
ncbi:MAG: hypothetical protein V3V30_07905 [Parvularculaceae bacterium]